MAHKGQPARKDQQVRMARTELMAPKGHRVKPDPLVRKALQSI
jgi:hypothetical protein